MFNLQQLPVPSSSCHLPVDAFAFWIRRPGIHLKLVPLHRHQLKENRHVVCAKFKNVGALIAHGYFISNQHGETLLIQKRRTHWGSCWVHTGTEVRLCLTWQVLALAPCPSPSLMTHWAPSPPALCCRWGPTHLGSCWKWMDNLSITKNINKNIYKTVTNLRQSRDTHLIWGSCQFSKSRPGGDSVENLVCNWLHWESCHWPQTLFNSRANSSKQYFSMNNKHLLSWINNCSFKLSCPLTFRHCQGTSWLILRSKQQVKKTFFCWFHSNYENQAWHETLLHQHNSQAHIEDASFHEAIDMRIRG